MTWIPGADLSILAGYYDNARREDGSIDWQQAEPRIYDDGGTARQRGEPRQSGFVDPFLDAAWLAGWDS